MKTSSSELKDQVIKELQKRADELQAKLKAKNGDEHIRVKMQKTQTGFKRINNPDGPDIGHGEFFFHIDITASKEVVFVPLSIASSKKPTGFVYHIEGTAEGSIYTTDISARGDGITKITLGTLLYVKIPAGKTASFRMLIEMRGRTSKEYRIVINRINYKLNTRDARYKRFDTEISTKMKKFL